MKLIKGDIYLRIYPNRNSPTRRMMRYLGIAFVNKTPNREEPYKNELVEYVFDVLDDNGKVMEQRSFSRNVIKILEHSKTATVLYGNPNADLNTSIAIKEGRAKAVVGTTVVQTNFRRVGKTVSIQFMYDYAKQIKGLNK